MSATHLHNHFYRCDDCGETFDDKGTPHECEGAREDVLAMLEAERETVDAVRTIVAAWRKADAHGLTGDPEQYLRQIEEAVKES